MYMRTLGEMTILTRDPSNDESLFKVVSNQPYPMHSICFWGRAFKSQNFHHLNTLTLSVRSADLLLSSHVTNLLLTL